MSGKGDLVARLQKRAQIRRSIPRGEPDRISDILEEAAAGIIELEFQGEVMNKSEIDALLFELDDAGATGLDLSPGDKLCVRAAARIRQLYNRLATMQGLINDLEARQFIRKE